MKAYFINKVLATTVVGSYPVVKGSGLKTLFDPFKSAVETAVADQVNAGIDIISDGQVRGDMIQAFSGKLPGIKGQDVVGKIQPASGAITAGDTKYAKSKSLYVKGIITGPSTLAHGLHISTPMYRNKEELALDLAAALAVEAKYLEAAGVTLLQIDEPIFSTGVADLAVGKQAIDLITGGVKVPTCMHVCGNIGNVLDDILKVNVNVLDFEFSKNPENLSLFGSKDLSGRMIGYGCVDSTAEAVETVAEIRKRIEKGVEVFGAKAMLVDPDCGLRMRSRESAFWKLKNMAEAAKEVRFAL
ncbi:methionine synthase [Methanoregula sp. UBA64]|jgi:5-methyltetrahydropteroyltriglutamate--homocysteine methyltransferase|uniref:methionine synthase n=1 Tax=Methanoregula sp. UBA64 TaxID=1915554 RepID=UPI0025D4DC79|nr:methionine synthase [Methanoregula sp. UBA64]